MVLAVHYTAPVSYTHLDVYKRQVRISMNSNIRGGGLSINFESKMVIIFADSEIKKVQAAIILHF